MMVLGEKKIEEKRVSMVVVDEVEKRIELGRHSIFALRKCSLVLKSGKSLAVLGSSGTGKSTLIHLIAGLERPSAGVITVENALISEMSDSDRADFRKKNIGVIYQFHHLLPEFNVLENVMMPLRIKRLSYNYAKRKASEILEKVGLGQKGKDQPATLSGGERQRVAIARAMVSMPSLILADEPTGNLDRVNARKIFKMILSLVNDHGSTLIVATHDLELAALCNDRRVLA
tara:strand:+ start:925 stop:1617 length:693 start_codon:yes stop_codon:yes gene_type:complete